MTDKERQQIKDQIRFYTIKVDYLKRHNLDATEAQSTLQNYQARLRMLEGKIGA